MNKTDLISAISKETGMKKVDAKKALDAFAKISIDTLKVGESVNLFGFGSFVVASRATRIGVNPISKEPIQIAAKSVVKFKASRSLNTGIDIGPHIKIE